MTIYSMTAFARTQKLTDVYDLVCEIRSINHRYLEISVHLPEALRVYEMAIRERLRKKLQRGKVECVIRYRASSEALSQQFKINLPLAQALCLETEKIAALFTTSTPPNPNDILRFPGVLEIQEINVSTLQGTLLQLIDETVVELIAARKREGEELKRFFLLRTELLRQELNKIQAEMPQILKHQRTLLRDRFAEAKIELDPERIEQELVLFTQKIDVAEEIERTATHIAEMHRILEEGGSVGRRLDFLLQELNREANTIGSKSVDSDVTHAAIEMKVLIEQIREQVQNVE